MKELPWGPAQHRWALLGSLRGAKAPCGRTGEPPRTGWRGGEGEACLVRADQYPSAQRPDEMLPAPQLPQLPPLFSEQTGTSPGCGLQQVFARPASGTGGTACQCEESVCPQANLGEL